jgi:hypothetical protein
MRLPFLLAALALASAAQAKDIAITLDEREQQALVQVLDSATRSGGLAATQGTVYFYNKLQTAVGAANGGRAEDRAGQIGRDLRSASGDRAEVRHPGRHVGV